MNRAAWVLDIVVILEFVAVSPVMGQVVEQANDDTLSRTFVEDESRDRAFLLEDAPTIEAAEWEHLSTPPSLSEISGYPSLSNRSTTRPDAHNDHPAGFIYFDGSISELKNQASAPADSLILGTPYSTIARMKISPFRGWSGILTFAKQSGEKLSDGSLKGSLSYRRGGLAEIIVGDFLINAGQGLVLSGTRTTIGEGAGRAGNRNESIAPFFGIGSMGFFRGGAMIIRMRAGRGTANITVIASHRPLAATVREDGSVSSLDWSGYARTEKERQKQSTLHETLLGVRCGWSSFGNLSFGATWYRSRFDKPIIPESGVGFAGERSELFGFDFKARCGPTTLYGEIAHSVNGTSSLVAGVESKPAEQLNFTVLFRSSSSRFSNPHASGFGHHTDGGNETGFFIGLSARPIPYFSFDASGDLYHFPGRTATNPLPTSGFDAGARSTIGSTEGVNVTARVRMKKSSELRVVDSGIESAHRDVSREHVAFAVVTRIPLGTSVVLKCCVYTVSLNPDYGFESSTGHLVGLSGRWSTACCVLECSFGLFTATSYDAAITVVEPGPSRRVSPVTCYGSGSRTSLFLSWKPRDQMILSVKLGSTVYGWKPLGQPGNVVAQPASQTGIEAGISVAF